MNSLSKITFSFFLMLIAWGNTSFAQENYGLKRAQNQKTLPKSLAKPVRSTLKSKEINETAFENIQHNTWRILNGWELAEADKVTASSVSIFDPRFDRSGWYNATVPGTVLTTLVDRGVYPDPYYGLNNLQIPDSLCRMDWWYRISFKLPKEKSGKRAWLKFKGINYKADVWLNGKKLGKIEGAFMRAQFDATEALKENSENILAVHIYPPNNPGIPHEESPRSGRGPNGGQLCLDGPTFISSEGWDWVPGIRDRNIGIWQDVLLQYTDDVIIENQQVITDLPLPDTSSAKLSIRATLKNYSTDTKLVDWTTSIGNITVNKQVELAANSSKLVEINADENTALHMKNPRLWWPNGYGKPELYDVKMQAKLDNSISDEKQFRIGIREMSYDLSVHAGERGQLRVNFNPTEALQNKTPIFDNVKRHEVMSEVFVPSLRKVNDLKRLNIIEDEAMSPYLVIKVNGVPIFCKGGNWGMDDAMKRVSRSHLEPYFQLHRDANFNMIRNWTGESTEEVFYELCDEYGMLVWNDFWLSTEGYNLNVNDETLFMRNAKDVVQRFRNHPSIAIWCPRNEGFATESLEEDLNQLIAKEDGTRHYHANSRNLNLRPSGPWRYFTNPKEYYTKLAYGFNSEMGTPSVPTAASMRKMMPKEDLWPISDSWYYHDLHYGQEKYINAIDSLYGKATDLDDFCKKAQMINYDSHRAMFESWNSRLWNNTSGLLLWMTHPAWPSTVWQTYSWDYETFGSYFGSKKACELVHIQMNLHNNEVVVVNTSIEAFPKASVSMEVFNLKGKRVYAQKTKVNVEANCLTSIFQAKLPKELSSVYLVRLHLKDKKGRTLSTNDYWKTSGKDFSAFNTLEKPSLKLKLIRRKSNQIQFRITNSSAIPAVAVKLNLANKRDDEIELPAYFSDGYFNLMPKESKIITVNVSSKEAMYVLLSAYNISGQKFELK